MTTALDVPYPMKGFEISQKGLSETSDKTLLAKYADSTALRALEEASFYKAHAELDALRKARIARRQRMQSVIFPGDEGPPPLPLTKPVRKPRDTKNLSPTPPPTPPHTIPYAMSPPLSETYEEQIEEQLSSDKGKVDADLGSELDDGDEDPMQLELPASSSNEPTITSTALTESPTGEKTYLQPEISLLDAKTEPQTSCDLKEAQLTTEETSVPKSQKEYSARKPLKIDTVFDRNSQKSHQQETDLYSQIRKNLRATPSTLQLTPSKSATFESNHSPPIRPRPDMKRSKRASVPVIPQSSFFPQTVHEQSPKEMPIFKPRPLKDAFIGVKGLTKRFSNSIKDSCHQASFVKQELSETSSMDGPAHRGTPAPRQRNPLQPSNNEAFPNERRAEIENKTQRRQSKPLPQISFYEMKQSSMVNVPSTAAAVPRPQHHPLIKQQNNIGDDLFSTPCKPVPPIPASEAPKVNQALVYPNPIPAYEPQLSRKASPPPHRKNPPKAEVKQGLDDDEQSRVETKEMPVTPSSSAPSRVEDGHIDGQCSSSSSTGHIFFEALPSTLAVEEITKPKKRVSFSSVVTDIPPPSSPLSYTSEEDERESNRTSSGILSRWQQQHQRDHFRETFHERKAVPNDRPSSNTSGFWNTFNSRTLEDNSKRAVRDTPSPNTTPHLELNQSSSNRFFPSTPVRNGISSSSSSSSSSSNVWINALQQSVSSRLSLRVNGHSNNKQDTNSALLDKTDSDSAPPSREIGPLGRKLAEGAAVLDERTSRSPPLNHPTKSRPMKPSSLRKSKPLSSSFADSPTVQAIARPPVAARPQWWIKVDHP
ncbi:hypothetical protein BX666DRAFT_1879413 [Dichotomocladium elegans]|nr:hypothetical protein BX666DRAFT_1879413 [Dichotomocladium elegans]